MSITLSNLALHQLKKENDATLNIQLSTQLHPCSPTSEQLVGDIHSVFMSKSNKGYGRFNEKSEFEQWLRNYQNGELDFLSFSEKAVIRLKTELEQSPFASESCVVFAEYDVLTTKHLMIGLLDIKSRPALASNFDVISTEYLDVDKMNVVACINLSTWQYEADSNRYLSYLQGRVGRKVADFFLGFLQAEEGLNPKTQNKVLMQALDDYCQEADLSQSSKQEVRQQVYDYCATQLQAGEDIEVKSLAQALPTNEKGEDFYQFSEEKGYSLEESFPIDKTAMRKLTKFVGAGGGVSINFEGHLLDDRIFYDEATDTLTMKGIPPNLKDQLTRYRNGNSGNSK